MPSKQQQAQEESSQARSERQRTALNNAYAVVIADQATQAFLNFGFEEAIDLQIEEIEGEGTELRPNKLTRLDRIEQQVTAAVEQLKAIPDEAFQVADEVEDANTAENTAENTA